MASGPRFLKLRGHTWYFQITVPKDLRHHFGGDDKVIKTTGERDLALAQPLALRWASEFKQQFNQLIAADGGAETTPREAYEAKLAAMQRGQFGAIMPGRVDDPDDPYSDVDGDKAAIEAEALLDAAPKDADGNPVLDPVAKAQYAAIVDWQKSRGRGGDTPRRRDEYGMTFSEAAKRCMKAKAKEIRGQSQGQYASTHRLFADFISDKAIRTVTRKDAAGFIDAVAELDPNWGRGRDVKELPLAELRARFGGHRKGLANKTINRYLTALNLVWTWAKAHGEVSGENPFDGLFRPVNGKTVRTYTHLDDNELAKLFAKAPKKRDLTEIALVALYSGMRLNEICSLAWGDIKREGRVWYFDITAAKSEAGVRVVPVHSKLRWLLDRRRGKPLDAFLWPDLKAGGPDGKRGWKFSGEFTRHRRACGIPDRAGIYRKGFHSLRKNATRCLELARVPQNEAAEILGHEKVGITYSKYNPEGLTMQQRRDVVEKIRYPKLARLSLPA